MEDIPALLRQHVTLQVESVDRVYLNGYVPNLQDPGGVYVCLRAARGHWMPQGVEHMPVKASPATLPLCARTLDATRR